MNLTIISLPPPLFHVRVLCLEQVVPRIKMIVLDAIESKFYYSLSHDRGGGGGRGGGRGGERGGGRGGGRRDEEIAILYQKGG